MDLTPDSARLWISKKAGQRRAEQSTTVHHQQLVAEKGWIVDDSTWSLLAKDSGLWMILLGNKKERDRLDWLYWPKLKTSPLALPAEIIGAYNPDFRSTDVTCRRMYWLAGKNAPFV